MIRTRMKVIPILKIIILPAFLAAQIFCGHCNIFSSGSDTCEELIDPLRSHTLVFDKIISIGFRSPISNINQDLWISFDSLITDSRCPTGVNCYWEGNAEISLRLFNNEFSAIFNLNTNSRFVKDTTINNYDISLIELSPYPNIDCQFNEDDYSAKLIISKSTAPNK